MKPQMAKVAAFAVLGLACLICLIFLFAYNPAQTSWFPRCPFYALTGYKCPGCGTLRGLHALLHFKIADALRYNFFMIVSIPLLSVLALMPRVRFNRRLLTAILIAATFWWIGRNLFGV